jgi:aspartyl/asparaginyl beta-hydroxylase (cupin superfamily)
MLLLQLLVVFLVLFLSQSSDSCSVQNATHNKMVLELVPALPSLPLTTALAQLTALARTPDGMRDFVMLESAARGYSMMCRRMANLGLDDASCLESVVDFYSRADGVRADGVRTDDARNENGGRNGGKSGRRQECGTLPQAVYESDRRSVYRDWGDALVWVGRRDEGRGIYQRGVDEGLWENWMCREATGRIDVSGEASGDASGDELTRYFYDVDSVVDNPAVDNSDLGVTLMYLQENLPVIADEVKGLLKAGGISENWVAESGGLQTSQSWFNLPLFVNSIQREEACVLFPRTCRILKEDSVRLSREGQVKFSLLNPNSKIRPHAGPVAGRMRIHCAISGISPLSSIRVGTETRGWSLGKCFAFKDWCEHEVSNAGDGSGVDRVVLIVDVDQHAVKPGKKEGIGN